MNRHIAIIDHVGNKAGMDYYSSSLARGFIVQDYDCTVYSNFKGIDGGKVDYKILYDGHVDSNAGVKFFKFIAATIKASYFARKKKSSLVILHLFSTNFLTFLLVMIPKIFSLKTAVVSHDVSSFANNDNIIIQNFIYNTLSDYIIVHNHFSYKVLLDNVDINNYDKVKIIKQGGYIDMLKKIPSKGNVRKELGLNLDDSYILFFGQIKKVKGLDILLESMSLVPDNIKLIIAGKPWKDDFSKYDELIEKYNLEDRVIKMIRFIEDDERERLFFSADVNVLPYREIYQSAVLLMAMSYSLPVIVSDLEANKETINDNENGLLFSDGDSKSLAEKITLFFEDKVISDKISSNGFDTIKENFDWSDISLKYIKLLQD